MDLGDLGDAQLRQPMEELHQEVAHRELNVPPGTLEVSFEQWYHEVQCVKDHYPDSVVQESIVMSLKGAVADMAWYMGPTTSMAHILQKLSIILTQWSHLTS